MDKKVLVAYASKYCATAGIAEKIGEKLREAGLQAIILPVKSVSNLNDYGAVVLGSAVYIGQWRKEAASFILANEKQLSSLPVWLFSSGPTEKGDPVELLKGWKYPAKLKPVIERIKPRDITVFAGALDLKKLDFFSRFIVTRMVKSGVGDARDWTAIGAWASAIAADLKKQA